jgi:DNA (cytosine-5)-methyltransferase 1
VRYISLFSGIEAASVAWKPLGWEAVAFSEVDRFSCAVLAHRYPDVPNLGDICEIDWTPFHGSVDVIVGGSPCQSFSVAGDRKGLDDKRGNLMFEWIRAVREISPTWAVWENVPGVLSSNKGRDFGAFLGALEKLGYGFAYRILDSQFFRVAQRRRRVFVVAHAGGEWRSCAAVLFEPTSLFGDFKSSKEAREAIAKDTGCGIEGTVYPEVARTLTRRYDGSPCIDRGPNVVTYTVNGNIGERGSSVPAVCLQQSSGTRGFSVSDDVSPTLRGSCQTIVMESSQTNATVSVGVSPTLTASHDQPIVFDTTSVTNKVCGSNPKPGDPCHTLTAGAHPPLCISNPDGKEKGGAGVRQHIVRRLTPL